MTVSKALRKKLSPLAACQSDREFGDFGPSIIEPARPDDLTITVGQLSNLTRHTLPRRVNGEKLVCENHSTWPGGL
jgi:hypothetical protein